MCAGRSEGTKAGEVRRPCCLFRHAQYCSTCFKAASTSVMSKSVSTRGAYIPWHVQAGQDDQA